MRRHDNQFFQGIGNSDSLLGSSEERLQTTAVLTPHQEFQVARRLRNLRRRLMRTMLANDFVLHEISVIMNACARHKRRIEFTFDVAFFEYAEKQRIRQGVTALIPRVNVCLAGNRRLVDQLHQAKSSQWPALWRQLTKRRRHLTTELLQLSPRIEIVRGLFQELPLQPLSSSDEPTACSARLLLPCGETMRTLTRRRTCVDRLQREYRTAKEILILSHLRLVHSLAKRYRQRGISYYDLVQEGCLGLMRAADKFDASHGTRFSTYATWWIRQTMLHLISRQARFIRLPKSICDRARRWDKLKSDSSQQLGRRVNLDEAAELSDLDPRDVAQAAALKTTPLSFDRVADAAEPHSALASVADDPQQIAQQRQLQHHVTAAIADLTRREQAILQLRYGLNDGIYRSLAEVGTFFSLTRERIRQIERAALQKLRTSRLAAYDDGH